MSIFLTRFNEIVRRIDEEIDAKYAVKKKEPKKIEPKKHAVIEHRITTPRYTIYKRTIPASKSQLIASNFHTLKEAMEFLKRMKLKSKETDDKEGRKFILDYDIRREDQPCPYYNEGPLTTVGNDRDQILSRYMQTEIDQIESIVDDVKWRD